MDSFARASALGIASAGEVVKRSGSWAASPQEMMRARGFRPSSFSFAPLTCGSPGGQRLEERQEKNRRRVRKGRHAAPPKKARQDESGGAVVDPAAVPCGHRATLPLKRRVEPAIRE